MSIAFYQFRVDAVIQSNHIFRDLIWSHRISMILGNLITEIDAQYSLLLKPKPIPLTGTGLG
jgi:hypothetical protein